MNKALTLPLLLSCLGLALLATNPAALADGGAENALQASPNQPWGDVEKIPDDPEVPWWEQTLLWVPNRLLDLVDLVHVDVGAGPTFGAVARVTKYGQAGFRTVAPFSVRVGSFGREVPVKVESASEFGVGPAFKQSPDRKVCTSELGLGLDLVVGAYVGICFDELVDFAGGIFFLDPKGDDLQ